MFFFCVSATTRERLHLAWYNFACAFVFTTAGNLLNLKVIGQRLRSQV